MNIRAFATLTLTALVLLSACGKKQEEPTTDTTHATAQQSISEVKLEAGENGIAYSNARLQIVSPREGQVLDKAADSVRVVMQVTGMDVAKPTPGDSTKGIAYSKQGQHVHIIVDDKPYMADYVNGQPFNIGVLSPGMHVIRAFPSRSWHESVKEPKAFAVRTFYVGSKPASPADTARFDPKAPLLTYSRPKGNYIAEEGKKVLLDFFVANAKLSPETYKVKVWVDGKEIGDITEWKPYYLTGLAAGKHTVRLQLQDQKGTVPGAFNTAEQQITIG